MDENPKISAKKQREKNLRYKRKPQDKQSESMSSVATVSIDSDPQPQRTNRRQRGEIPKSTNNTNTVTSPPTSENKDTKPTTEKENVIDFSNLKRETEEISKLTKKYTKRNISSNWHRYSAPEGPEDEEDAEQEAPADFSALIKMPTSKGGHLLLKDEQEWSSNSKEQLGGYFALNLKLLSESLDCIPIYEQLSLPRNMFNEEELNHFDILANNARKVYNPYKSENSCELVTKPLLKEVENVADNVLEKYTNTSKDFSVLNAIGNNEKEPSPNRKIKNTNRNSPENIYCLSKDGKESNFKDKSYFDTVSEEKRNSVKLPNEVNVKNTSLEALTSESVTLLKSFSEDKGAGLEITAECSFSTIADPIRDTKNLKHDSCDILIDPKKEILQKSLDTPKDLINENTKNKGLVNSRKSPEKKLSEIKHIKCENPLKFEEDDDDLDFLLSLKKPAERKEATKKKNNSFSGENSTHKGESGVSSTQTPSELDDWLDSVLQN